jgi:hypothetical protein
LKKSEKIAQKIKDYTFAELIIFINEYLEIPITANNIFYEVKTADHHSIIVWGTSEEWILQQFERYLNLRFYY